MHSGRIDSLYLDELTAHKVTGATFHTRWREWRRGEQKAAAREADGDPRPGSDACRSALTERGIRQTAPRFSPDGGWIAYTSRTSSGYARDPARPSGRHG